MVVAHAEISQQERSGVERVIDALDHCRSTAADDEVDQVPRADAGNPTPTRYGVTQSMWSCGYRGPAAAGHKHEFGIEASTRLNYGSTL